MRQHRLLVLGLSLLIAGVSLGFAQPGGRRALGAGPGGPPGDLWGMQNPRGLRFLTNFLDLTDEQEAAVKKIFETEREIMKPVFEQLRENRLALQEATKDGKFNEAQVTGLAQQQGQLIAQTIVSRERVKSQVYQLLTPEQRDKLGKAHQRFERWMENRPQGRRGAQ